jgi:hypothetical protein
MPQVGFQPMNPLFEQAKTFHTLDRVATVMGCEISEGCNLHVHNEIPKHQEHILCKMSQPRQPYM